MALNLIWSGFFIAAAGIGIYQSLLGNYDIWQKLTEALWVSADMGVKTALGLTGVLCFWLGLLKVAEKSGLTAILAKLLRPWLRAVMPDLSPNSPAFGSIALNMAANILGLDNAATPMGLRAMEQMQAENPHKDRASNPQVMFMVLNSSSLTLLPVTILMYRFQFGSANPALVFIPILLATLTSTLVGFLATAIWQKINIFRPVVLAYIAGAVLTAGALGWWFAGLDDAGKATLTAAASNAILFGIALSFIVFGLIKKQNVYENFIEGAKDGFKTAVMIIPYLVAMLAAIGVFRAAGGIDALCKIAAFIPEHLGFDAEFVKALPAALMKPLSGSGARAMMLDIFKTYGADSFAGFVASIVQGSTETTFYVLAVYFGAVNLKKTGAALPLALLADAAGITAAVGLAYAFY
ncbi:MAG: hypothetical protein IJ529_01365 [Alphaproteobacteria bacterium]|nr:hypothetical protein [Alphaproteobacteria bacterium]MBQ9234943.1 hypothetical protein [Alphaproteobacteria bacterium]